MTTKKTRPKNVTSHDVAKHAGVSRAAVSRAFAPNSSVSDKMREKVHKSAKELGYRVNYLARSLINQRSDLVGVVVAGLDNPFRTQQIEQLSRALLARNFRPVLLPADSDDGGAHVIEQLLHYSVSGVLVTSDAPPTSLCEECAAYNVPIVLINKGDDIPLVDRIVSDDKTAGEIAAEVLIDGGVERPAVMAAAAVSYTARRRVDAFTARCKLLGFEPKLIPLELNDYFNGFNAAPALREHDIDGLFCISDYVACGTMDWLARDNNPAKPIKIIGHDDIPQASWDSYQLTTILQPCDIQAEQAVNLLVERMDDPEITARVEFTPVTLVKRKSA